MKWKRFKHFFTFFFREKHMCWNQKTRYVHFSWDPQIFTLNLEWKPELKKQDCTIEKNALISSTSDNVIYPAVVLFLADKLHWLDKFLLYTVTDWNIAFPDTSVTCDLLSFVNLAVIQFTSCWQKISKGALKG